MVENQEKILVVESDPIISDLVARQALGGQGFQIKVVANGTAALQAVATFSPDVVIANLELEGLSGKDMMAALSSQSIRMPVIMIASKGKEKDVIQAFRLGASDYVGSPVRETEVVAAVERAMLTVRAHKESEQLSRKLQRTNEELKKRVNELTTIFSVGKAVTSSTGQIDLYDKIVEGAVKITAADYGWMLILDERTGKYLLCAHHNLPKSLSDNLWQPWDDGISSLVAASGEPLAIHGVGVNRFKIAPLGQSILVTPVKVQSQTIALLSVMRKATREFVASDQAMLSGVSDYASISMVNARLFQALDERAASLQIAVEKSKDSERLKDEVIQNVSHELRTPLVAAKGYVDMIANSEMGKINKQQDEALGIIQKKLNRMVEIIGVMNIMHEISSPRDLRSVKLNDLINQAVGRYKKPAQTANIKLNAKLPPETVTVQVDPYQIGMVLDALLSNAIKFSPKGGNVVVRLQEKSNGSAQISISDEGIGISKRHLKEIFNRFFQIDGSTTRTHEGLGIGLALVKDIVTAHGGKVSVNSKLEIGTTFHITLPPAY